MKTLSIYEIKNVAGGGYTEDIAVAAQSLFVASAIGSVASSFTYAACSLTGSAFSEISPEFSIMMRRVLGPMVAPVMFYAAPVVVFVTLYSDLAEEYGQAIAKALTS